MLSQRGHREGKTVGRQSLDEFFDGTRRISKVGSLFVKYSRDSSRRQIHEVQDENVG